MRAEGWGRAPGVHDQRHQVVHPSHVFDRRTQTRLPEAHFAVHAPLYHEILWALSQIARLQLKYCLKYSLTDRWCIKCFFHFARWTFNL